jgi:membrane-associated protein
MELIDFILHVDRHLGDFVAMHGVWIYALLFLIVFVETGVVVMPLLPGDSLLFAAGTLAAAGHMDIVLLLALLFAAAVLGDSCNYLVGRLIGPRVYDWDSRWIKREYLRRTQDFFARHGGKAVILARFVPIIRTCMPFIAGVGAMHYRRFLIFNVVGGGLWVGIFLGAGYGLGNLPFFKDNFSLVVLAIIVLSLMPAVIAWLRQKVAVG